MPARTRLVFLALSAGLFAGCAVGPDYRPPESRSPRLCGETRIANRELEGLRTFERGGWRSGTRCSPLCRVALEQNLDIAQAGARVAQAMHRSDCRPPPSSLGERGRASGEGLSVD